MVGPKKPRRQRRTYSCGQCKIYKIKCDLGLPCQSCKKFNRIEQCIQDPPNPPSETELAKIRQRQRRVEIRKLQKQNGPDISDDSEANRVSTPNSSTSPAPFVTTPEDITKIELNLSELTMIHKFLPRNTNIIKEIFNAAKKAIGFHLTTIIDLDSLCEEFQKIHGKLDSTPMRYSIFLTMNEVRLACYSFVIIAIGSYSFNFDNTMLHRMPPNQRQDDIRSTWLSTSDFLFTKAAGQNDVLDVIFHISLYFIKSFYYFFASEIHFCFFDYNKLLNYLINSGRVRPILEKLPEYVSNPVHRKLAQYAVFLRMATAKTPYFHSKAPHQMEYLLEPSKKTIRAVFGDEIFRTGNFLSYQLRITSSYFQTIESVSTTIDILSRFYHMWEDWQSLLAEDIELFESRSRASSYRIQPKDLELLHIHQRVLFKVVKKTGFLKLERNHFPSLYFISYASTMLCQFNHFFYMIELAKREDNNQQTLLEKFTIERGVFSLESFYSSVVYLGVFVLTLKSFLPHAKNYHHDLQNLFTLVADRFRKAVDILLSDPSTKPLHKAYPWFRQAISVSQTMKDKINDQNLIINDPIHLKNSIYSFINRRIWDFFVNNWFGNSEVFKSYLEQLWGLLSGLCMIPSSEPIPITSKLNFDFPTLFTSSDSLTGFKISHDLVEGYINDVVRPVC